MLQWPEDGYPDPSHPKLIRKHKTFTWTVRLTHVTQSETICIPIYISVYIYTRTCTHIICFRLYLDPYLDLCLYLVFTYDYTVYTYMYIYIHIHVCM